MRPDKIRGLKGPQAFPAVTDTTIQRMAPHIFTAGSTLSVRAPENVPQNYYSAIFSMSAHESALKFSCFQSLI